MTSVLLATKLHCPAPPSRQVSRPQLIRRLNEGLESGRQITLISAPAGFGKSTCAAEWISRLTRPTAWLALDRSDDDPARFFTYLIAALQQIDQGLGSEIEAVLRSGQLPPLELIISALTNNILKLNRSFLLVLDDFQALQEPAILEALEYMIANQPGNMHLVLLTREEPLLPLARLRAGNRLTEIRAADLRFTAREASCFLNEIMNLHLSAADIARLEEKTEGWVAGLQLAGLSIRDRADASSFIATLSGSHRHILSYLTEEVLRGLPDDIQQFLLQTSILDRLNGDLCNAVTGRMDSHLLLETLLSHNLFLIPLDDERQWYRYHHLFADLLCDLRVTRDRDVADLHRRASRWYAQAGIVPEAVEHALAAQDHVLAVGLIESHAMELLMGWHAKTVAHWMQALPPEWSAQSPKINLAFAWTHLLHHDGIRAARYIEALQTIFSDASIPADRKAPFEAEWMGLRSMLLSLQGKPIESIELANQALQLLPEQDSHIRSLVYMGLASAYQHLGHDDRAVEAYQMLIRSAQAANNLLAELLGVSALGLLVIQHGRLHEAFAIASQGVQRIERLTSPPPISTAVYGELGQIYFEWHQIEQAHAYFQQAIRVSALTGFSDAEIGYRVICSRLRQMEGDLAGAADEIQRALDLMHVDAPAAIGKEVAEQQVRLYLAQNRLAAAEAVLVEHGFAYQGRFALPDPLPEQTLTGPDGPLYNSLLRILLYRANVQGEHEALNQGLALANRLVEEGLNRDILSLVLETLLLRAQMQDAMGSEQQSLADLIHALQLAEPQGFVSVFVEAGPWMASRLRRLLQQGLPGSVAADGVSAILTALSPSKSLAAGEEAPELLTDREADVLRLIAEGLTYDEIAAKLFISLNTVRSHVKTIYGKLEVNNRTRAIEKARQLSLL